MSSITPTGTAALEGRLWSVRADDWAAVQERQVAPAYEAALDGLLAHARARVPGAEIIQGELEQLPYDDASFDVVTGFNSFQYAARPEVALAEARRAVRPAAAFSC